MNKTTGILIGIVVVILIGVGVFSLSGDDTDTTTNEQPSQTQTPPPTTPSNNAEKMDMVENSDMTIDLVMSNFEFSQDTINAKPGDTVTINLSVDSGSHDFVIDELDVQSEVIGSSATDTVTFTIPEDAADQTYTYYCSLGNHRDLGMEGQLIISE